MKKPQKFSKLDEANRDGILIIDSGLGSVTLLKEVRNLLPNTPVTLIADSAEFPYGKKSPKEIVSRVCYLAEFFLPLTKPSTLLLACNTASTVALPALREKFHLPVVGIVPAVKPASIFSKSGTIALLATPETAKGPYVDDLINSYANHCNVIRIGCPNLASIAEKKL